MMQRFISKTMCTAVAGSAAVRAAPAVSRVVAARGLHINIDGRRGEVETVESGEGLDWRMHFRHNVKNEVRSISPWMDIPLRPEGDEGLIFNYVNEIPKGGTAKLEISTDEDSHPIKQDVKKGKLRFYHSPSLVNYGCLPQTWEDPGEVHADTGLAGDDDPLDVLELSSRIAKVGEVYEVRVFGVLGMIDEGEMDWKLLAIRADDPEAEALTDVDSPAFPKAMRDRIEELRIWFRDYKIPDGKPANEFAFDNQPKGAEYALQVISDTHNDWAKLRND